jgi:uncharacterized delta-60 repeat protein
MIAFLRRAGTSVGLVGILVAASAGQALAAAGDLDTTFGGDGKVTTNFTSRLDEVRGVAVQGDGKIVVAGNAGDRNTARFALARYNTDGTLDTTFSGNGKATTNFTPGSDGALAVAIQGDGKIVAAGRAGGSGGRFALARYNTDGTLDTTFSGNGKATTNFTSGPDFATGVALQVDGKIVAAGGAGGTGGRFALARYNTDGTLDSAFSSGGKQMTNFSPGDDFAEGVAIQADGKIVTAGTADVTQFALARYNTNGTLDSTFSGDGMQTTDFTSGPDFALGVAIQGDGKIVTAGTADFREFALARYTTAGALDTTFGGDGTVTTNLTPGFEFAEGVALQADGKIVAAGSVGGGGGRFGLVRYLAA